MPGAGEEREGGDARAEVLLGRERGVIGEEDEGERRAEGKDLRSRGDGEQPPPPLRGDGGEQGEDRGGDDQRDERRRSGLESW